MSPSRGGEAGAAGMPGGAAGARSAKPAGSRAGVLLAAACALGAFAALVGLGTWQLERLAWKQALIARVEARVHAPAVPLPDAGQWGAITRDGNEYQHVRVRGVFDHDRETLVYAVRGEEDGPPKGQGFLVVTPLMRSDGPPVLVNRGFVPAELRDPARRARGQVGGEVEVTGLLRLPEEASWFVPANDPAKNAFYRKDPAEIAAARGLAGAAPFLVDADAAPVPGDWPLGGVTRLAFPNRHLEYALTWYGLAATLVGVCAAVWWSRRRGGGTPPRG